MADREVARVVPAVRERFPGLLGIFEIAGHHVVAAHQDFAERFAVRWHLAALVVDDSHRIGDQVVHALAS